MSHPATAAAPSQVQSIPAFLDDLLVMRQRRATPDERAACKWWREQVALLAKRAPAPAEPEATPAAPAAQHAAAA